MLLLGEQGIGDQLMFASMIPDLARATAALRCVCDARLVRLFANSFDKVGFDGPTTAQIRRDEIDAILAMGSLGGLFRGRAADFPGSPYLRPSAAIREAWGRRLGPASGRLRVGLSWRGGLPSTRRNERSLALNQLQPLFALPGCEFVSLQYGEVAAEVADAAAPIRVFPPADIDDFEDLAGLVANLDVVVSVQTALVHLAGAVGKTSPDARAAQSGVALRRARRDHALVRFREAVPPGRARSLGRRDRPGRGRPARHAVARGRDRQLGVRSVTRLTGGQT